MNTNQIDFGAIHIGQTVFVRREPYENMGTFKKNLAAKKNRFLASHKDVKFKVTYDEFGAQVTRVAKKINSDKYDLVYQVQGRNPEIVLRGLPWPVVHKKYLELKTDPRFRSGSLMRQKCI